MTPLELLSERVNTYLGEMGLAAESAEDGLHLFKYGSTVVSILLFEEGDDTFVRFSSFMLKDCDPNLELVEKILHLNNLVLFGSFLLSDDNTLSFAVTLFGNALELYEFKRTLQYVAKVSDDYDDEFQAIAGGKRAVDVLREG